MRGDAAAATLLRPRTTAEALRFLAEIPEVIPLAGGTDVMVAWNAGGLGGRTFVDLTRLTSWARVRTTPEALVLGALTTHSELIRDAAVRRHLPLLAAACATVGGPQIQNRGTLGGNLANASPAGDTFPPLLVYGAVVATVSRAGTRTLPLSELFTGVKRTALAPGELIEAVIVPRPRRPTRQLFRKVGTRAAQAISKAVAAGLLWLRRDGSIDELRFALGSMAPTARRLTTVEAYVRGKRVTDAVIREARTLVAEDVKPVDDVRSTAGYRLEVSRNLLAAFLRGPS